MSNPREVTIEITIDQAIVLWNDIVELDQTTRPGIWRQLQEDLVAMKMAAAIFNKVGPEEVTRMPPHTKIGKTASRKYQKIREALMKAGIAA